jgi:hypothetical protein
MASALSPEDLKKKDTLKAAAKEEAKTPPGTPAFLKPEAKPGGAGVVVAKPEEVAKSPPTAPVVIVPVEKEDVR